MGDLYLFDHDGDLLHPRDEAPSSVPRGFRLDNALLQLGVDSAGSTLQCLVNGVETNETRTQAIATYQTTATNGVFGELIDAVEAELLKQRGWTITPVENERNPGYVFQRIRNAASGKNPNPKHVPMDHEVVHSLLEDGHTVTFHVRDYSVAGDLILRFGNVGRDITVAESPALGESPSGLIIVQDDSVDRALELSQESKELVREKKLENHQATVVEGVRGLSSLGVSGTEAAKMVGQAVHSQYEDVDVVGPQEQQEVSKLAKNAQSLRDKNERLREQLKELETKNRRLESKLEEQSADPSPSLDVGASQSEETAPEPDPDPEPTGTETEDDDEGFITRKRGLAILVVVAIILLTLLSIFP